MATRNDRDDGVKESSTKSVAFLYYYDFDGIDSGENMRYNDGIK